MVTIEPLAERKGRCAARASSYASAARLRAAATPAAEVSAARSQAPVLP